MNQPDLGQTYPLSTQHPVRQVNKSPLRGGDCLRSNSCEISVRGSASAFCACILRMLHRNPVTAFAPRNTPPTTVYMVAPIYTVREFCVTIGASHMNSRPKVYNGCRTRRYSPRNQLTCSLLLKQLAQPNEGKCISLQHPDQKQKSGQQLPAEHQDIPWGGHRVDRHCPAGSSSGKGSGRSSTLRTRYTPGDTSAPSQAPPCRGSYPWQNERPEPNERYPTMSAKEQE